MRFAAGACLLSAGLLIGGAGGGIAAADTDSSGAGGAGGTSGTSTSSSSTSAQSQGADASSQPAGQTAAPAATIAENLRKTLRETIQGVTSTLNSFAKPGQQSGKPKTPVAKPETDATNADQGTEPTTDVATPLAAKTDEVASDAKLGGSDSKTIEVKTNVTTPAQNGFPAAFDRPEAMSKIVDPVANVVATVATVAQSVPGVLAALPTSTTPIADVITSLQYILTTVGDAVVPLATELPSNLFSLLVMPGDGPPASGVLGRSGMDGLFSTVVAPDLETPFAPAVLPVPDLSGFPLLGNAAAPVALGEIETVALRQDFSLSATTPLQPSTAPHAVMSFLEHTINAILLPASLSALAAFALPGVAGLIIVCAAGMRLGYRQAKAAMAVRNSAIARFAGAGPMGVVRSGSLIALRRPRGVRRVRPQPLRVAHGFEQIA